MDKFFICFRFPLGHLKLDYTQLKAYRLDLGAARMNRLTQAQNLPITWRSISGLCKAKCPKSDGGLQKVLRV